MHKPLSKTQIRKLNQKTAQELKKDFEIVFLLQDVIDPVNVGGFFRLADAFGIKELALTNNSPTPPNSGISLTARGLERTVKWQHFVKVEDAIEHYKSLDFEIVAVELTEDSKNFAKHNYKKKLCLIFGNEASGVYKKTLALCDTAVHIPMQGKGPSLNVYVSAAVVMGKILDLDIKT